MHSTDILSTTKQVKQPISLHQTESEVNSVCKKSENRDFSLSSMNLSGKIMYMQTDGLQSPKHTLLIS